MTDHTPLTREEVGEAFWLVQYGDPKAVELLRDQFEAFQRRLEAPPEPPKQSRDGGGLYL
jgi:hypothetical protein